MNCRGKKKILLMRLFGGVSSWLGRFVKGLRTNRIFAFLQGNSNSLASIDVAPGYVGQTEYNPLIAGMLIVVCTYAMPVLAYLLMIREVLSVLYDSQESWVVKRSVKLIYIKYFCLPGDASDLSWERRQCRC